MVYIFGVLYAATDFSDDWGLRFSGVRLAEQNGIERDRLVTSPVAPHLTTISRPQVISICRTSIASRASHIYRICPKIYVYV